MSTNEWFQAKEKIRVLERRRRWPHSDRKPVEWLWESYIDDIAWNYEEAFFFSKKKYKYAKLIKTSKKLLIQMHIKLHIYCNNWNECYQNVLVSG